MNKKTLIAAMLVLASTSFAQDGSAQEVQTQDETQVALVTENDILELEDAVSSDDNVAAVPEPTAFGLLALGLAVGGGLLVRRKD